MSESSRFKEMCHKFLINKSLLQSTNNFKVQHIILKVEEIAGFIFREINGSATSFFFSIIKDIVRTQPNI